VKSFFFFTWKASMMNWMRPLKYSDNSGVAASLATLDTISMHF